jgi:LPXTG-motif cell wall-anchored protein
MKSLGPIVLVVGVLVIILGVVRHFSAFFLPSTNHISIILGVVGLVIAAVGFVLFRQGSNA